MGQDPYGGGGDFTPYQPGDPSAATPDDDASPSAPDAPATELPFVPYGAATGTATTPAAPTAKKKQVWPWIVVGAVVLGIVGSCAAGIVSVFSSDDGTDTSLPEVSGPQEVGANDLEENQCLRGAGLAPDDDSGVSGLEVVDCADSHEAEVMAIQVLSEQQAADYDFNNSAQVNSICPPRFDPAERPLLKLDELSLIAFTATEHPVRDDKVVCLLVMTDGSSFRGPLINLLKDGASPNA